MLKYSYLLLLIIACASCICFSLLSGSMRLPYTALWQFDGDNAFILWQLRLPRTMTAFVTGGLLALSGTLMQLLLQNPLADPYALGISGGAAFFTLLAMFCGLNYELVMSSAWLGSLLTMCFIVLLAKRHLFKSYALLLCGIAVAYGFSAGISLLLLLSPNRNLQTMLFWLAGDLNDAQFPHLGGTILVTVLILCLCMARGLNVLIRGDIEATTLGVAVTRYRIIMFFLSSLCAATAVWLAGCIGFVGLIIPHLTRLMFGIDHRIVLPIASLLGGSLLVVSDAMARSLFAPQQIPVGIVTACIGVPMYLWFLRNDTQRSSA